jgi:cell shape-determining protein MreC
MTAAGNAFQQIMDNHAKELAAKDAEITDTKHYLQIVERERDSFRGKRDALRAENERLIAEVAEMESLQEGYGQLMAQNVKLREALQSVGLARSLSEANRMIEEFFGELGEQT